MAQAKYFWGASVYGSVTSTPASSFAELVAQHLNVPYSLAISSESYQSMPKKIRQEEVKGRSQERVKLKLPYITPATFNASPCEREYVNATHCNLIALDIDVAKDGRCPAAPFVTNPSVLHKQLSPFSWAAYQTISSTPEKPRIRIFVAARKISIERYADAVNTIAARIGLPFVTHESKTAVQAMFLPCIFNDQDIESEHPVFASELSGREFVSEDIDQIEEDEIGIPIIKAKEYEEEKEHDLGDDALFFLRPPVQEIDLVVVKDALSKIDPDISYPEWFEIAAAMRHQFRKDDADKAFDIFDEWSATGTKYGGAEETMAKWNAAHVTPKGRAPVTIRTLLHRAVEHGWSSSIVKEKCFASTMAWIKNDARTQTDLMTAVLHKIAATPLMSHTEEEALLHAAVDQAKKLHKLKLGIASLRDDLKRLKEKASRESKEAAEKMEMPTWLRGWIYVASTNEFYRHTTNEKLKPEAFDLAYAQKLVPTEEQLEEMGEKVNPLAMSKPMMKPRDFALNLHTIKVVYDYKYDPAKPGKLFTIDRGSYLVNTYRKSHPEPNAEGAEQAAGMVMKHLSTLIPEKEWCAHVMDWVAYCVQYPGRKIRHAILFQGPQGCGKTYFYRLLQTLLGKENSSLINFDTIQKGWNDWAIGRQVIGFEEIRAVGHNRYDLMNTLKELITNDEIPVNERNRSTVTRNNISNYMLFTNHADALPLTGDDRRYVILKSQITTRAEVEELQKAGHFRKLFGDLSEKASALRHYFENYSISDSFDPDGMAPRTRYAEEMIHDTADDTTTFIRELIEDASSPLVSWDVIGMQTLKSHMRMSEIKMPHNNHIAFVLQSMGYTRAGRYRMDAEETERQAVWVRASITGLKKNNIDDFVKNRIQAVQSIGDIW